jgi:hypothetical protein
MGSTARSYTVTLVVTNAFTDNYSTVLAGGTFPGPLIQGTKVGVISKLVNDTV